MYRFRSHPLYEHNLLFVIERVLDYCISTQNKQEHWRLHPPQGEIFVVDVQDYDFPWFSLSCGRDGPISQYGVGVSCGPLASNYSSDSMSSAACLLKLDHIGKYGTRDIQKLSRITSKPPVRRQQMSKSIAVAPLSHEFPTQTRIRDPFHVTQQY